MLKKKLISIVSALSLICSSMTGVIAANREETVLFNLDFRNVADGTYDLAGIRTATGETRLTEAEGGSNSYIVSSGVAKIYDPGYVGTVAAVGQFDEAVETGCLEIETGFVYADFDASGAAMQLLNIYNSQTKKSTPLIYLSRWNGTQFFASDADGNALTFSDVDGGTSYNDYFNTGRTSAVIKTCIYRESTNENWTVKMYDITAGADGNKVILLTYLDKDYYPSITEVRSCYYKDTDDAKLNLSHQIVKLVSVDELSSSGNGGTFGKVTEREYTLSNLNLSLTSSGTRVEVPSFTAPFDIGSMKITYNSTSGGTVYIRENSSSVGNCNFGTGSGQVVVDVFKSSGIKRGSTISFYSYRANANISSITFYKENSPGYDYYKVDITDSSMYSDEALTVGTEYASVESYFPFDTSAMELTYSASEAETLYAQVNGTEYSVSLSPSATSAIIYFNDGISPSNAVVNLKKQLSSSTVKITDITFVKENLIWPDGISVELEYTSYEDALQTAIVFKTNSNIYKAKNAIRYISYDNTSSVAFRQDGMLYAPIDAMMIAFSLYREDKGTSYLYRSDDNALELTIRKSDCIINEAGEYCYPVKTLADYFGYTVFEYEDYLIADKYKTRAKNLKANSSVLSGLKAEFDGYEAEKVAGNTWYVSASVGVSGNGSENAPFKTIQEAANVAVAGDKVIINSGTYRETVKPQNSGTVTNPIIFEAAPGATVTVSALDEISGFELYRDGIYAAELPVELDFGTDFVMYNGQLLVEGRHPNSNTSGLVYPSVVTSPLWPVKGTIKTPLSSIMATSDTDLSIGKNNALLGATYIALKGAGWNSSYGKVTASEEGVMVVKDLQYMMYFPTSGVADWGYITNSLETLDVPGEWYAADGVLYIIPPKNAPVNSLKVEAKQRYLAFDLRGKSCVQFKNINSVGGSFVMDGDSKLNIINGGTHKYTSHYTYPFDKDCLEFTNPNCIFQGKSGNCVSGENNAVVNTTIDTGAGSGLMLSGRYAFVFGNTITDMNYSGYSGQCGILICTHKPDSSPEGGHNIHFNTVSKASRTILGVQSKHVGNNTANDRIPFIACEVSYNDFSYGNVSSRDSGIIYMYGACMGNDLVRSEFHHNVLSNSVFNGSHDGFVVLGGAYADNMTGNGRFHHNIAYYEGDFKCNTSYNNTSLVGNELYLSTGIYVQSYGLFGRTYSVFESYSNMGHESGTLNHAAGFDKTNAANYPNGKMFNYGA